MPEVTSRPATPFDSELEKEVRERIRPTHWFTLTSSDSPREVGALVDHALKVLDRLGRNSPGLACVIIGSNNGGSSSAHVHGLLRLHTDPDYFRLALSKAWGWGDVIHLEALDPEGGAVGYVIRQLVQGEILWLDGERPRPPAWLRPRPRVAGVSLPPGKQRRLLNKRLGQIEAHDRLNKEVRKGRERERQRIAAEESALPVRETEGRIIRRRLHSSERTPLATPPVPVRVHLEGARPIEIPLVVDPTTTLTAGPLGREQLIDGVESGRLQLPTVIRYDGRIGMTPEQVAKWLGLRHTAKPRPSYAASAPSAPALVVDPTERLALELEFSEAFVLPPAGTEPHIWLRVERYAGSLKLISHGITDAAVAGEMARLGVRLHLEQTGLGAALGSRRAGKSDCVVVGSPTAPRRTGAC